VYPRSAFVHYTLVFLFFCFEPFFQRKRTLNKNDLKDIVHGNRPFFRKTIYKVEKKKGGRWKWECQRTARKMKMKMKMKERKSI